MKSRFETINYVAGVLISKLSSATDLLLSSFAMRDLSLNLRPFRIWLEPKLDRADFGISDIISVDLLSILLGSSMAGSVFSQQLFFLRVCLFIFLTVFC